MKSWITGSREDTVAGNAKEGEAIERQVCAVMAGTSAKVVELRTLYEIIPFSRETDLWGYSHIFYYLTPRFRKR